VNAIREFGANIYLSESVQQNALPPQKQQGFPCVETLLETIGCFSELLSGVAG
jgi:hypothetical protein